MADTKISALTAAAALAGTEAVPVVQSAATVKTTLSAIAAYVRSTITGYLTAANNLSDLASAATARTNLGLLRLVAFFFTTTPTASEVLALYVAADAFTIPANMSGTQVKVGTNATATFAIDVQQNGTSIGTISIATSGTATLTTTSGTAKPIAAGDVLKFVAPASADATIANVAIAVKGTL